MTGRLASALALLALLAQGLLAPYRVHCEALGHCATELSFRTCCHGDGHTPAPVPCGLFGEADCGGCVDTFLGAPACELPAHLAALPVLPQAALSLSAFPSCAPSRAGAPAPAPDPGPPPFLAQLRL